MTPRNRQLITPPSSRRGTLMRAAYNTLSPVVARQMRNAAFNAAKRFGNAAIRKAKETLGKYVRARPRSSAVKKFNDQRVKLTQRKMKYTGPKSGLAGYVKKGKRYPAVKDNEIGKNGIWYCREASGTMTDTTVMFIGHSTGDQRLFQYTIAHAIVKALMKALKTPAENFQSLISGVAGDKIYLNYRAAPDGAISTNTYTVVAADTWTNVAQSYATLLAGFDANYELIDIYYAPLVGGANPVYATTVRVRLTDALVKFKIKSALKIQNRSTPDALGNDDQSDEVDNVPLYGKSYEGPGAGSAKMRYGSIYGTDANLWPNLNGVIKRQAVSGSDSVQEPPKPYELLNARKTGKIRIEPGEIKTSMLYYTCVHKLNVFINKYFNKPVYTKHKTTFGNFRVFCLEKVLETSQTTAINMSIGYEHDIKYGCVIYTPNRSMTVQVTDRADDP